MNILIIEDDRFLAWKIQDIFSESIITNRVSCVFSYHWFLSELHLIESYDIILVDILLDDCWGKTGIDILKIIRKKNTHIPVVIISGISELDSMESAFLLWANDYLVKPFRLRELQIRVTKWFNDYIKTPPWPGQNSLDYYGLQYHYWNRSFTFESKILTLSKQSKYLLSVFLIHSERTLSERYLQEKLWWDYDNLDHIRNIRVCITRLKEKLRNVWIDSRIQNIRAEWYIFQKIN